jgi:uncharacterized membrane protein
MISIFNTFPLNITGPASGYLLLVLGFLALLVIDLIIALIEGVTLTLLKWNPFRQSLTISLIMNITSGILNGILLILLQRTPFVWLSVSFVISLLIEGFIMSYFKRDAIRQNSLFVLLANLVSYILFILPAYYFGAHP